MELQTAERLETRARGKLAHAMDRMALAQTETARQRHARRAAVAAEMVTTARLYIRALSD